MTYEGGSETTFEDRVIYDEGVARLVDAAENELWPLKDGRLQNRAGRRVLESLVFKAIREWTGE